MKSNNDIGLINLFIPEQFTVKAHPVLFEGEWEEGGEPKNEALLFQSTVDNIHFQNAHKTQKLRRLALCAFIYA